MSTIGNLVWLVFGGLLASFGYVIGGLLLCLTIFGIPFGMQSIRLGIAVLIPFGKTRVTRDTGVLALIFDVIWLLTFGWPIAATHFIFAVVFALTILGIPFAKQHWKLIPVALLPFSMELRGE